MARQDYEGAPISGVTGNVAGSTTSDAGSSQSRGFTDSGSQGENTVIQPTGFRLGNSPGSTVITRSPLQQFRFNRDTERANRVASYTPANRAEFEAATGRTRNNFSPDSIFARVFGAENVRPSKEDLPRANAIYDLNLDKFMNPDLQSKIGLRGMVGDPVTGGYTIAKQVAPMSTSEMGARLFTGLKAPFGPLLSMLPGNNVSYVSTGNEEVYDVEQDPRFNKDLSSGIMGNLMKTFSGGTDLQEAGGRVMDLGRQGLGSLTERFGSDLDVPAGVMGSLSSASPAVSPMTDTIAAGTPTDVRIKASSPARKTEEEAAVYRSQMKNSLGSVDTLRNSDDQAFLSEQFTLTPSQMMLNARELNQDVGLPGGSLQLEYNPDTDTKGIQYKVPINSLLRMLG